MAFLEPMRFSTRPDPSPPGASSPARTSRRQRVVIVGTLAVIAVLGVVALGLMKALLARLDDGTPLPPAPVADASPVLVVDPTSAGPVAEPLPAVATMPPQGRPPSPVDELSAGPPGTVPVCGVGRVPTADGIAALNSLQERHAAELEAALEQMTRSGDQRVRAVALLLGPTPAADLSARAATLAVGATIRAEAVACPSEVPPTVVGTTTAPAPESQACRLARAAAAEAAERHRRIVRAPQVEALRQLGETSNDPAIVAIALQSCIKNGDPTQGCQYPLIQRWAQLDPGNGWTALEALAPALQAADRGGVDAALARIAAASHFAAPDRAVFEVLTTAIPVSASPGVRAAAAVEIASLEASWSESGPFSFGTVCSPIELRDPNRRQLCSAAAEAIAGRGDTLVLRSMVPMVGQFSGWDAQRVKRVKDDHGSLMAAMYGWYVWGAAPPDGRFSEQDQMASLSCGQVDRLLRQQRGRAVEGEVASMRRLLAADRVDWRASPERPR
jgi:hypothetical protein